MKSILSIIVGAVIFLILDALWVGFIMNEFYVEGFGFHLSVVDGALAVQYLPALLLYLVISIGIYHFVRPTAGGDIRELVSRAALFGFVMYGFYDLTNAAILADYPWSVVIVDTLWGTFAVTATAVLLSLLSRRFSLLRSHAH